jgi:hypothetical protein
VVEHEATAVRLVRNIRSKWETCESTLVREAAQRQQDRQNFSSTLLHEHITRLQDQLGSEIVTGKTK